MDLTNYEIKIINMLFNSFFKTETKKRMLEELDTEMYIDLVLNGASAERVNKLVDSILKLEDKIEIVQLAYKKYGFEFEDIHQLIENRNVLIFNYYDNSWRNKRKNRFNRYCYC